MSRRNLLCSVFHRKYRVKDADQKPTLLPPSPSPLSLGHRLPGLITRLLEQSLRSRASEPNGPVQSHTPLFPGCEAVAAAAPCRLLAHAQNWGSRGGGGVRAAGN